MRRVALMLLLGWAAGVSAGCGGQRSHHAPASEDAPGGSGVVIRDLHARPSPNGVTVGAIFMVLRSAVPDTLVSVSVPAAVAGRAEVHAMVTNAQGQMEMIPVPALPLPAGADVELKPGGRHIMLFALGHPLAVGGSFPLTLRFSRSGEQVLEVPVRED